MNHYRRCNEVGLLLLLLLRRDKMRVICTVVMNADEGFLAAYYY